MRVTWRIRGSKQSETYFYGTFDNEDDKVLLTGEFKEPLLERFFVLVWFSGLVALLAVLLYAGLFRGNRSALGGAALATGMIAAAVWIIRTNAPGRMRDMTWVTSVLREALST